MWTNAKKQIRVEKLLKCGLTTSSSVLEIGAFASPTLFKEEYNVVYADRHSTLELQESTIDIEKRQSIVGVDYVIYGDDFYHEHKDRFDFVVANHVIEHIPDLITWLHLLRNILKKDGHLFLSVPDKNYTFDKLRDLTTLREILNAYFTHQTRPSLGQIIDFEYYKRPIFLGGEVWSDTFQKKIIKKQYSSLEPILKKIKPLYETGDYIDCHCNVFSCDSFTSIFNELEKSLLIPFSLKKVFGVEKPYNEFHVILKAS